MSISEWPVRREKTNIKKATLESLESKMFVDSMKGTFQGPVHICLPFTIPVYAMPMASHC